MVYTFMQVIYGLERLSEYLRNLGLTIEASRIDLHAGTIAKLEQARAASNLDEIDEPQTRWSMTEAIEFIEIERYIRELPPESIKKKRQIA